MSQPQWNKKKHTIFEAGNHHKKSRKKNTTKKSPPGAVLAFAQSLRISPAIPAGRVRYECKSYTVFKPLIGTGKLRPMFGIQGN